MTLKIFVSYRRADTAGYSTSICDRLKREFGSKDVFMDTEMRLGENIDNELEEKVRNWCDVLVAVIGPKWLDVRDDEGKRRLDDPNDRVRFEIATALRLDIPVVPVMVDGAKIPIQEQLPETLKDLPKRKVLRLDHDALETGVKELVANLKKLPPRKCTLPRPVTLREFSYPLAALGVAVFCVMLSAIGVLPPQHELLDRLKDVLLTGSLIWLFIICAIESTVAVNLYFPGALVILATMAAAEGHPGLIAKVFFTITSGQIFGYLLDYAIGYRFKHLLESVQLQPWRPSWQINAPFLRLELLMKPELMILLTYGHPHSAALTSYSLGAEQGLSAGRFAIWALIGVFVWGGIWTFICLNGGNTLIRNTPWGPVFFGFIFFWFAWIAVRYYRQGQR